MNGPKFLLSLPAFALALAACTADVDNPLSQGPVALSVEAEIGAVSTRVTAQNAFQAGDVIGIIPLKDGAVETTQANVPYMFGKDEANGGALKLAPSSKPYYFRDQKPVTFRAYYPYEGGLVPSYKPDCLIDIDTHAEYQKTENLDPNRTWRMNDYLFASATTHVGQPTVRFAGADNAFRHVMSQVQLVFKKGSGVTDLSGEKGLTGYTISTPLALTGTFSPATGQTATDDASKASLAMNFTVPAGTDGAAVTDYTPTSLILLPQAVDDGGLVVDVTFNNQTYRASLALPAVIADGTTTHPLQAGYAYTYTVTVKNTGLEVSEAEIKDWQTDGTTSQSGDAEIYVEPQVGDYYYSDGTYSSELITSGKTVVGLVFRVGHHDGDKSVYTESGIKQAKCRGYVMALTDARNGGVQWSTQKPTVSTHTVNRDNVSQEWSGYDNTRILENAGLDNFPAAKACADYDATCKAPEASSGWFFPSSGQMEGIYNNNTTLTISADELKKHAGYGQTSVPLGDYWTSSCSEKGNPCRVNIGPNNFANHLTAFNNESYPVRAVLAF